MVNIIARIRNYELRIKIECLKYIFLIHNSKFLIQICALNPNHHFSFLNEDNHLLTFLYSADYFNICIGLHTYNHRALLYLVSMK